MAVRSAEDQGCQPWWCEWTSTWRLLPIWSSVADVLQWLLLEPWITPSIFRATGNDAIVDEYTFCQYQDRGVAQAALRNHWETFIVENDIKWLSGELSSLRSAAFCRTRDPLRR